MKALNDEIKKIAKERKVFLWEIAQEIGINDGNFSRMLRKELPPQKTAEILNIIDMIATSRK